MAGKERRRDIQTGCLLAGCLTPRQQVGVSQGRILSDKFTCCHTETEVADPTFYLTRSQYTDTGPTSPNADLITPGAWQGSHWSANLVSHWYDSTWGIYPRAQNGIESPELLLSRRTPLPLGQRGVSENDAGQDLKRLVKKGGETYRETCRLTDD